MARRGSKGSQEEFPGTPGHPGVNAYIRLRPPSTKTDIELFEFSEARKGVITIKDPLSSGRCEHSFEFSGVFTAEADQEGIFAPIAGPIIDDALAGQSGCILAYGQTGSGKTYSIFGSGNGDRRGILPRALERLFAGQSCAGITASFLEVYMDQVYDLIVDVGLADHSSNASTMTLQHQVKNDYNRVGLDIREAADGRVHVQGLQQPQVHSLSDVRRLVQTGLARRAMAKTTVNAQSSRSHTVFTLHLPARAAASEPSEGGSSVPTRQGAVGAAGGPQAGPTLSFVDLAGSERISKSRAEGARFQEAVSINCSLTALGKVVLALASGPGTDGRPQHVPYRDSKLTRLLSPSLGGGAKVALIATIHPRVEDYEESLHTLSFADRCKNVAHQPQINYVSAQHGALMRVKALQAQVKQLQDELLKAQTRGGRGAGGELNELGLGSARSDSSDLDKAIAKAVAFGDVESIGGASSDPGLCALIALKEEHEIQARKQEQALKRMEEQAAEQELMRQQVQLRSADFSALGARTGALERELQAMQAKVRKALEEVHSGQARTLSEFRDGFEKLVGRTDNVLLRIPEQAARGLEAARARQEELAKQQQEHRRRLQDALAGLSEEHALRLGELREQWQAQLDAAETRHSALAERVQKQPAEDLDHASRRQAAFLDACGSVAVAAGGLCHRDDASQPRPPVVREASAGVASAADSAGGPSDSEALEALGKARHPDEAAKLLAHVPAELLPGLCLALRGKCLEAFSVQGEREALLQEALHGLEDEATVRYLHQLRGVRDASRAALADAVERTRRLRVELEASRGRPPGGPPPAPPAAWRPLSAGRRPKPPLSAGGATAATATTRSGSRASTRPTTAQTLPSRPTSAAQTLPSRPTSALRPGSRPPAAP